MTPLKSFAARGFAGSFYILVLAPGLIALSLLVNALPKFQSAASVFLFLLVVIFANKGSRRWMVTVSGALLIFTVFSLFWGEESKNDSYGSFLITSLAEVSIIGWALLRKREALFAIEEQAWLLQLTHDTVIIRDDKDVIVYWNNGAASLYGWTREEALGRTCASLLQCEYPTAEVAKAIATGSQWSGEISRSCKDGSRVVLASRWFARRNPNGCPIGTAEVSTDITEQKRDALELQFSERRYKAIFHAAGFATWEADWSALKEFITDATKQVDGDLYVWLLKHPDLLQEAAGRARIREINQAAVNLFELESPDELVGSNVLGRMPLGWEEGFAKILAAVAGGAEVVEAELRMTTTRGRVLDVVMRATPVPDGKPWSRALVMAFDETERKEARERLEQTKAELVHAARISTLGQLAASIAHEVKQPLTAVTTYGKSGRRWLLRPEPETSEAAVCFDHIVSNATRAVEIIDRVRAQARKAAPQAGFLDLSALASEAIALVQREADGADVTVRRIEQPDPPLVWADRVQVQQVLVNLMINGIQAMRNVEGRRRQLCIGLHCGGEGSVEVSVQDCGTGIAGDANRIFEPFFTTKQDGMGLGLSICKTIIQDQGGRIYAVNNPGFGATVAFQLPVAGATGVVEADAQLKDSRGEGSR